MAGIILYLSPDDATPDEIAYPVCTDENTCEGLVSMMIAGKIVSEKITLGVYTSDLVRMNDWHEPVTVKE
jgi:hypothetical protein